MKKRFDDFKIYKSDSIDELNLNCQLHFPLDKEFLKLLKEENKCEQEYYYIERKTDYAFFVLYKNKMNLFTFGKLKLYLNFKVIGLPCSLSNFGYITNNESMLLDYIKTIKGVKLILNVSQPIDRNDYIIGKTLPTCIFKNNYKNLDEYMKNLRSNYRRRINIALKDCKDIEVVKDNENKYDIYSLYLNTYNKSNYKLEKLEKGFFEKVDGTKLIFLNNKEAISFVLLKKIDTKLIFMFCGMDYNVSTASLYYLMLYNIIKFAIDNKCELIDFGQTSETSKLKIGAFLEKKYFYASSSNRILNLLAKLGKNLLEYNYKEPNYNVFKERK